MVSGLPQVHQNSQFSYPQTLCHHTGQEFADHSSSQYFVTRFVFMLFANILEELESVEEDWGKLVQLTGKLLNHGDISLLRIINLEGFASTQAFQGLLGFT